MKVAYNLINLFHNNHTGQKTLSKNVHMFCLNELLTFGNSQNLRLQKLMKMIGLDLMRIILTIQENPSANINFLQN